MFQVREENKREVSGIEQGQIIQEIIKSGLVGQTPDERRVFLATLGIDCADSFNLTATLPDFLSDVCHLLACQWRLAQFAENFRHLRDGIKSEDLTFDESAIHARSAVCLQHLDSFVAYCRGLPADMKEQLKLNAIDRISRELRDEP